MTLNGKLFRVIQDMCNCGAKIYHANASVKIGCLKRLRMIRASIFKVQALIDRMECDELLMTSNAAAICSHDRAFDDRGVWLPVIIVAV
jgi:hypothetical protein